VSILVRRLIRFYFIGSSNNGNPELSTCCSFEVVASRNTCTTSFAVGVGIVTFVGPEPPEVVSFAY